MKRNREQQITLDNAVFYTGCFIFVTAAAIFAICKTMYLPAFFTSIVSLAILYPVIILVKQVKKDNEIIRQERKTKPSFDDMKSNEYREMLITILNNLNELRKTDLKVREVFPFQLLNLDLSNFWREIEVAQHIEKQKLRNSGLAKLTEDEKKALEIQVF